MFILFLTRYTLYKCRFIYLDCDFFFALFPLRRVTKYQRVIRILKSKERQHNGQKKKDKQPSTKHHTETKDRPARTPQNPG